jgi:hypothetical protein
MLPESVIELVFLGLFNLPIDNLPRGLKKLNLGYKFNNTLFNLPKNLEYLNVGMSFNQPLGNLPNSITVLHLGKSFNNKLTVLPKNIDEVIFDSQSNYVSEFETVYFGVFEKKQSHGHYIFKKIQNIDLEKKTETGLYDYIIEKAYGLMKFFEYDIFE